MKGIKWRWIGVFDHLGVPTRLHFGQSSHALAQQYGDANDVLEDAEQEYWVSTAMLILLLLDVRATARVSSRKALAECLLGSMLDSTLTGEFCLRVQEMSAPQAVTDLCGEAVEDTLCRCWRSVRRAVRDAVGNPQHKVAMALMSMHGVLMCATTAALLKLKLHEISGHVDQQASRWGDFEWHKPAYAAIINPTTCARRRADFHVKQFAFATAFARGPSSIVGESTRSLNAVGSDQAVKWLRTEMAAFQAASHLSFAACADVALTYDAARLGQPGTEILVVVLMKFDTKRTLVLPRIFTSYGHGLNACSNFNITMMLSLCGVCVAWTCFG